MSDTIKSTSEEAHDVVPPLIDSLHYEPSVDGFSIIFIPSQGDELTQTVFIARDSGDGWSIAANLYRVQSLIGNAVDKISHCGGNEYAFRLANADVILLSNLKSNGLPEVLQLLRQIAQVAEGAFSVAHAA